MMPARTTTPRGRRASSSLIPHPAPAAAGSDQRSGPPHPSARLTFSRRAGRSGALSPRCPQQGRLSHRRYSALGQCSDRQRQVRLRAGQQPGRIACTGAGTPVISSNWRKAWCSNMSSPVTRDPAGHARRPPAGSATGGRGRRTASARPAAGRPASPRRRPARWTPPGRRHRPPRRSTSSSQPIARIGRPSTPGQLHRAGRALRPAAGDHHIRRAQLGQRRDHRCRRAAAAQDQRRSRGRRTGRPQRTDQPVHVGVVGEPAAVAADQGVRHAQRGHPRHCARRPPRRPPPCRASSPRTRPTPGPDPATRPGSAAASHSIGSYCQSVSPAAA